MNLQMTAFAADGDINVTPVDGPTEYNIVEAQHPEIANVTGDIYVMAYTDSGGDVAVETISITTGGTIGSTIDSQVIGTEASTISEEPDIAQVDSDTFAISYQASPTDVAYVTTVDIDGSGNISAAIDTIDLLGATSRNTKIIPVSGDVYAVAYDGSSGSIATIEIDSSGVITDSVIETYAYFTPNHGFPEIINISGSVFGVVYSENPGAGADHGYVETIDIPASGTGMSTIDTLDFIGPGFGTGYYPEIINVDGDIYAIAYSGAGSDGKVGTVDIDVAGNIGASFIDSLTYDAGVGLYADIDAVSGSAFAITYNGVANDPQVITVEMDASGNITNSVLDGPVEFDTVGTSKPDPETFYISGSVYGMIYQGDDDDGYLITYEIETTVPAIPEFSTYVFAATLLVAMTLVYTQFKKPKVQPQKIA